MFGFLFPTERHKTAGRKRSSQWKPFVRAMIDQTPWCAACGCRTRKKLIGHHIVPFHIDPSKELDPDNILVLCESRGGRSCHFMFHGYNWSDWLPDAKWLAQEIRSSIVNRKSAA